MKNKISFLVTTKTNPVPNMHKDGKENKKCR